MKHASRVLKENYPLCFYGGSIATWLVYIAIFMSTPGHNVQRFHLSVATIIFIRIFIAVPYLFIWLTAAYAHLKLKDYAATLPRASEKAGFELLSLSMGIFGLSMMASTIAGALKNQYPEQKLVEMLLTIASNYLYVLPFCFAFYLFYVAVKKIAGRAGSVKFAPSAWIMLSSLIVFAYFWLDLIFTNTTRTVSYVSGVTPTYYLNDSLIILTIVAPSFLAWVLGILASVSFRSYYNTVTGSIYRNSLSRIVSGLFAVILSSILLHAILSLGTPRLLALGVGPILAIVLIFQLILATGFILVARGATKLARIETV